MPRPKPDKSPRDDTTPLTVTVYDDKGRPAVQVEVNGWSSANAVTSTYTRKGKQTQVTPRTG